MNNYSNVISNLIRQYEKALTKQEEYEQTCRKKKMRLVHTKNIKILKDRLECLKILIEYLSGSVSDYSRIKNIMNTLQEIITAEDKLQEYYNAATLESLRNDLKMIIGG